MVRLLNLLDPDSLVDQLREVGDARQSLRRDRSSSAEEPYPATPRNHEQHSALSRRGVALLGGTSAFGWYLLRLVLRDKFAAAFAVKSDVLELHALSTLHSLGWVFFLLRKLQQQASDWPQYCSRALVASLGFYLHDCWALRGTLLRNPAMLAHQASAAVTISSILRSKGVAWLGLPLMSHAVPTLVQELLQLCGTAGLPATRPEVRALRLLWFTSFAASKLALVPLWCRHHRCPELHQPNLLSGKVSYIAGLVLNLRFMLSAARDLPRFLRPEGDPVPAAAAYRLPLQGAEKVSTAIVAGAVLTTVFGSYLAAPAAMVLALLAIQRRGSLWLRLLASASCLAVALDQALPMPRECDPTVRLLMPLLRRVCKAFHHRFYPSEDVTESIRQDRHYLVAATPHGFFPWGVAMMIVELLDQGYLPNFVGASVLGTLPVAGRLLRSFGYRPATRGEIRHCLKKEYPRNVTIILPGGIREMFNIRQDVEVSAANLRTGFAELATEAEAFLVPAYMFGNSRLYEVAQGPLGKLFERLSRRLQTSLTLFHGRWGSLLPYPHRLACALGEPIDTRKVRDVKEVHTLWLERLRRAFDRYKGDFGWPDRRLFFEGEAVPPLPADPLEAYTALPHLSKL